MPRHDAVSDPVEPAALERRLRLLTDIDEIRDAADSPEAMLSALTRVMAGVFSADTAQLFVVDQATQRLELRAVREKPGRSDAISTEALMSLASRSLETADVATWVGAGVEAAHVAMVPIVMGQSERLGTLFLARTSPPFDDSEMALMRFAESQLDSALVQAQRLHDLDLRNKELETIYRVDHVRDLDLSFDDMLDRVLGELRHAIPADMAFIMLYDRVGRKLEMRALSKDDASGGLADGSIAEEVARRAVEQGELILVEDLASGFGSVLCTPLILRGEILGVFGLASRAARGFRPSDALLLSAIASQMDTAIFENLEQRRLRQVLGRSVDPNVMERLLAARDVDFLEGERQVLSVLYADLRGSTALAKSTDPALVVGFINDYLSAMADTILRFEGTLDKFVGDEVMALFGAPFPMADHALRAVRTGVAMQQAHRPVMERWIAKGVDACPAGVGIATGELTVGEMGSAQRSDYTVIGHAANLGARICGRAAAGQVLISPETYELVREHVETSPPERMNFKGIGDLPVYEVTAVS